MKSFPLQTWIGIGHTDIGRQRKKNQDAFSIHHAQQLWVLADGMGGHAGGEVASQIAVEVIPEEFQRLLASHAARSPSTDVLESAATQAIETANLRIREHAHHHDDLKGMGTTIVVVVITHQDDASYAVVAHAGDSRAYCFRQDTLSLWTKDHTLMEERLALKIITPEQVRTHPLRHVLTKGLGIDSRTLPTVQTYQLEPTDILLLCSDGLTKMLSDLEIQTVLKRGAPKLENVATSLVDTANRLGGEDNTTVIVIGADPEATVVNMSPSIE